MTTFSLGDLVISLRGRDTRTIYMVLGQDAKGRICVSDGKYHPLQKPKAKNPKHLRKVRTEVLNAGGAPMQNEIIKAAIKQFRKTGTFTLISGGKNVESGHY